ncbi:hypothetical protein EJB05_15614 [Eragrostis curvula]|uniref:mevalonate kinase n=1 Tax=Eragrostis curvula TaxID=38414 RepID=A0A5J9VCY5_9POAL|nr:hypothetical protein EJB05_15614 [Eragrostis curvula]
MFPILSCSVRCFLCDAHQAALFSDSLIPRLPSYRAKRKIGSMEVRARAPGKIILAGEHAVVHGSAAVAAAIDLYTSSSLRLLPAGEGGAADVVELDLKDSCLTFSWPCSRLREVLGEGDKAEEPRPCSPDELAAMAKLLEEHEIPEAKIWLSAGLSAFLFLYTSILGCRPGKVVVASDLPMGAGLGSSAAFCVSMSGALLTAAGAIGVGGGNQGDEWEVFGKDDLDLANRWAFQGEKIIHGKPSGIDNAVSTFVIEILCEADLCHFLLQFVASMFGSMIKFKKGDLTNLTSRNPVKMLITDTRVGRNTKALVAGVSERASRHPDAMASVFHAVNSISEELSSIVELAAEDEVAITSKEEKLAELMEMNQGLLQCMGVSHASIETVLQTSLKYNLVSKLTGAGGGGCVLTLIPTCILFVPPNCVVLFMAFMNNINTTQPLWITCPLKIQLKASCTWVSFVLIFPDSKFKNMGEVENSTVKFIKRREIPLCARDPITALKNYIIEQNLATESELKSIEKKIKDVVEPVEFVDASPHPPRSQLLENVFADPKGFGIGPDGKYRCEDLKFTQGTAQISNSANKIFACPQNNLSACIHRAFMSQTVDFVLVPSVAHDVNGSWLICPGLLCDDQEWSHALNDAAQWASSYANFLSHHCNFVK